MKQKEELESLGYHVEKAKDVLESIYNITMSWIASAEMPEQIDLYFLSGETIRGSIEEILKAAHYIGSVYPESKKAGRAHFAYRMLSKKGRFLFEPPIEGLVKISVTRLTPVFYTLDMPGGTNHIGGLQSAEVAWKKAGEVELAGGFEYYVDALD